MRESPSGQPNPSGFAYFNSVTIAGSGGTGSVDVLIPEARVGDSVAYSTDDGSFGTCVPVFTIATDGHVVVSLLNVAVAPITINGLTLHLEILRRG